MSSNKHQKTEGVQRTYLGQTESGVVSGHPSEGRGDDRNERYVDRVRKHQDDVNNDRIEELEFKIKQLEENEEGLRREVELTRN